MSSVLRALDLVSAGLLVVMALVVGNTTAMGVRERTGEYAVLCATGFRPRHVVAWVVAEAVLVGALGGALGVAFAWPFVELGVGPWLEENVGWVFHWFRIDARVALLALVASALMGGLAAAVPAWRAARLRVVEALRRVG